jgi:ApaG protein
VLNSPVGEMHGTYQMVADDGKQFDAVIDTFVLNMPRVLH